MPSRSTLPQLGLLLLVAVAFAPLASAAAPLQGDLTSTAVTGSRPLRFEGTGLLLGFFSDNHDQPLVDWSLRGDSVVVDRSSYNATSAGGVTIVSRTALQHAIRDYGAAAIQQVPSTLPAENQHEFWMLVTPLGAGYTLRGEVPAKDLQPRRSVSYLNDAAAPGPFQRLTPSNPDGIGEVPYSSDQPALEWKPDRAAGALQISGDFDVAVFQADFVVTGGDGTATHYATGDDSRNFPPAPSDALRPPVYQYSRSRADIVVHGGALDVAPNGRALQLDLAGLRVPVAGGLDFENALGSLALPSGAQPLDGRLHLVADALTLDLAPAGDRLAARFRGTVESATVDGKPLALAPATATATQRAPGSLVAGLAIAFAAGAAAFTVVAVRRRADNALLIARAQAFFEVGRNAAALRMCRRLLRSDPGNVDATTVAAMSLVRLGRPAEAKPLLERGLASGDDHQGLLCVVEALVLFHEGDARTAARRLQEAFRDYPALNNELAAVDLLDQILMQIAEPSEPPLVVSP